MVFFSYFVKEKIFEFNPPRKILEGIRSVLFIFWLFGFWYEFKALGESGNVILIKKFGA